MPGKFVIAKEIEVKIDDVGASSRLSDPHSTGARQLTVIDVNFDPGKGHGFHKHPDQEEVILVIAGKVEQWVDREKRILGPGDSAFIQPALCTLRSMRPTSPQRSLRSSDRASDLPGMRWSMSRTTPRGRRCGSEERKREKGAASAAAKSRLPSGGPGSRRRSKPWVCVWPSISRRG
jgi:hypothetical protein